MKNNKPGESFDGVCTKSPSKDHRLNIVNL